MVLLTMHLEMDIQRQIIMKWYWFTSGTNNPEAGDSTIRVMSSQLHGETERISFRCDSISAGRNLRTQMNGNI